MQKNKKYGLFKLTLTAVLLAVGIIVRAVASFMPPIFGVNTMRISLEGIFVALPGLLFGPIFGGVAYGLMDILGLIVNPVGAWIPLITLNTTLLGVGQGLTFKLLKKMPENKLWLFLKVLISLTVSGIIVSVLNSIVIFYFVGTTKGLITLIIARLVEEIVSCVVYSVFITILLPIIKREEKRLFK